MCIFIQKMLTPIKGKLWRSLISNRVKPDHVQHVDTETVDSTIGEDTFEKYKMVVNKLTKKYWRKKCNASATVIQKHCR